MQIYQTILEAKKQKLKSFAVLIDPDKTNPVQAKDIALKAEKAGAFAIFVGGSLLIPEALNDVLAAIKQNLSIPVFLFPGSNMQVNSKADALLLLSLISGRNPDLLIGQHVIAAPMLKNSGIEIVSTGYMLVDGGRQTSVSYISNTTPIPADKPSIAVATAMAGEMLGLKLLYLDGGSGALNPVPNEMIKAVKKYTTSPLFVGGGINTPDKAYQILMAGADTIVIGTAIEKDPGFLSEISGVIKEINALV